MKRIIYTLITILTLTFCFYIIQNKVYAHNINEPLIFLSDECSHIYVPDTGGGAKCIKCGHKMTFSTLPNGKSNFEEKRKIEGTKAKYFVIILIVLSIVVYTTLSIRKKIKDKKYYNKDE